MQHPTFKRTARVWDRKTNGYVDVTVEITIDIAALADHMAAKVHKSKARKSVIQGGIIVARGV